MPLEGFVLTSDTSLHRQDLHSDCLRPHGCLRRCTSCPADAISQQLEQPLYEHTIDLTGAGENVQPGDVVQFQVDNFPLFPEKQLFRVKSREIIYAHESHKTRLYLTTGFESAPSYFYYLGRDDLAGPLYVTGRIGPFQLDVSALDSAAHLDVD